jgi:hypothetical protein
VHRVADDGIGDTGTSGVAEWPDQAQTPRLVLKHADEERRTPPRPVFSL